MADKYNSITKSVTAIKFTFDVLKDIYLFLGMKDVSYFVKNRTLSAIITGTNDEKLNVQKNDYIVKDSSGNITIWKPDEFEKNYVKTEESK